MAAVYGNCLSLYQLRVAEDTVVYADISPRFEQYDHEFHATAWTISPNYDDKVKYAEIINSSDESTLDSGITSGEVFMAFGFYDQN